MEQLLHVSAVSSALARDLVTIAANGTEEAKSRKHKSRIKPHL
jgi:hypothetical protein